MAMSAGNYQIHFANMGKLIKLFNQLETDRAGVVTTVEAAIAILKDDENEVNTLAALLSTRGNIDSGIEGFKSQVRRNIESYITEILSKAIGFTGASASLPDVLEDLAEDMTEATESIDGSAVSCAAPTYDADNTGDVSLTTPASLSQLVPTEFWEVECIDASVAGSEVWQVRGEPHLHGVLAATLTTAVAYTAQDANGRALWTATLTVTGDSPAVGDKVYFKTTNGGEGTFSEFFRKLGIALPVNLAGGETISDALAE